MFTGTVLEKFSWDAGRTQYVREAGYPKTVIEDIVSAVLSVEGSWGFLITDSGDDEADCKLVSKHDLTDMQYADLYSQFMCPDYVWKNAEKLPRDNINGMSLFDNEDDIRALVVESGNQLYVTDPISQQHHFIGEIAAPCLQ